MKKNENADFEKIKKNLLDISETDIYNKIENYAYEFDLQLHTYTSKNVNMFGYDIKILGAQLAYYFTEIYKNFEFTNFNDKNFVTASKTLIKNCTEFNSFLKMVRS